MTQKALKLRAEVSIHSVSCPGVFFQCKGPVSQTSLSTSHQSPQQSCRFTSQYVSWVSMSRPSPSHRLSLCCSTTSKRVKYFLSAAGNVFFVRFMFEKTFATCLTLDHLQGALTADNVYMELLQVSSLAQGSHGLHCVLPGDSRPPGCCSRYI